MWEVLSGNKKKQLWGLEAISPKNIVTASG